MSTKPTDPSGSNTPDTPDIPEGIGGTGQSPLSPEQTWEMALGQLQMQMTQATFDTWLANTQLISATNSNWQITVKTAAAKEWLENRLRDIVQRTLTSVVGISVQVEFRLMNPVK